ncbi:hypothetical protein HU755_11925 [Pseudomonas sp. SWRI111]|uniref:hypothetical protein n=1 Tax=Pseudomonas sp. SWRI111 TaxID=2745507 RepID=UPI001648BD39|nr:hypothetical protein [Pseudomonas sp. SWRI111]MBC3207498.1 hypothetical protein [Pseudomonas sp. SWRI111]
MSRQELLLLLKNSKATGSFVASIDGKEFLHSEQFLFHNAGEEFFIIGSNNNEDWVVFSVPTSLEGGPHTVKYPFGTLEWDVLKDNDKYPIKSGSVTVTFDKNKTAVSGDVNFIVKNDAGGAKKVTGKFEINQ